MDMEAEYGEAAHWAYKETAAPVQQAPADAPKVKARTVPERCLDDTSAAQS